MISALVLACTMFAAPASIHLPKELDRVLRDYERGWRNKDAKALADLFTEDGFAVARDSPFASGRAEIAKQYEGGGDLHLRAVAYHMDGNLAIIIGAYTYGSAGNSDRGKFTLTLKRKNKGEAWLIFSDMDNGVAKRPK